MLFNVIQFRLQGGAEASESSEGRGMAAKLEAKTTHWICVLLTNCFTKGCILRPENFNLQSHPARGLNHEPFCGLDGEENMTQSCKPYLSNAGQDTSSLISEPSLLPVTEKTNTNADKL